MNSSCVARVPLAAIYQQIARCVCVCVSGPVSSWPKTNPLLLHIFPWIPGITKPGEKGRCGREPRGYLWELCATLEKPKAQQKAVEAPVSLRGVRCAASAHERVKWLHTQLFPQCRLMEESANRRARSESDVRAAP